MFFSIHTNKTLDDDINFVWKVHIQDNKYMNIHLSFNEPILISDGF